MSWKRPDDIPYPKYWGRFYKTTKDGINHRFSIWDATEDDHDFLINKLLQYYFTEEPVSKAFGILNDEQAKESAVRFYRNFLKERMALMCFEQPVSELHDDHKFAGCIITVVRRQGDNIYEDVNGKASENEHKFYDHVNKSFDAFEYFQIDELLGACGLLVAPKYRGLGICEELLKAGLELSKAVGMNYVVIKFTNVGSQLAAKRLGFEEVCDIDYTEAKKIVPEFNLDGIKTKSLKIMYKRTKE